MTTGRIRRVVVVTLTYLAIVCVTLVVFDLALIGLGLFPPKPNSGDADLGWSEPASGRVQIYRCRDFATHTGISFARNEAGMRTPWTVEQLRADTAGVKIAVTGDSQTDLCATNEENHPGILEARLAAQRKPTKVMAYGAGRYSPLQAYLAFRRVLRPYHPDVLILNLYTGNDFLDILRVDDRPHFVAADTGYRIAPPVWFLYDDPGVQRKSRVLFVLRSLGDKTGIRGVFLRVLQLRQLAAGQGKGITEVFRYFSDLRRATEKSLDYPDAFTAQWLNQELFFRRFPGSRDESVRRIQAVMDLARRENPGMLLVMSPLPSYQLAGQMPVDRSLLTTLERLGVSLEEGVKQEGELYERLRALAAEKGWLFVDNLAVLRAYSGNSRLYNGSDYHLLPPASDLVGTAEAKAISPRIRPR